MRSTQRFSFWSQEIAFFHAAHFFCADVLRGKRLKSDTGCHDWEEQEVENGSSHGISVDVLNTGAVYDDLIKIIPFRTGCWSRCLPFAGNYGVMSAKPWRSAAGAAVTGFGRWGIDNRVIFQQNIILQFSVKLVCQSVIACVCYRKRIFMETM